jgi:hypothetical protein
MRRRRFPRGQPHLSTRHWLKELGLVHDFSVQPITPESNLYRVWITRGPGAAPVLITDVGFGVSQILPVLTICYFVPEGSTILLEQPEIHLHPAVQSGLADVFIDFVKRRGVQLVVESHSEHLLRRLRRRMAEEQLAPERVALYFAREAQGASRMSPLEVDEFGNIRNWPPNFFGDEMGDLAAMAEAADAQADGPAGRRMTHWAVDTNVPRVANSPHDSTHASPECVLDACAGCATSRRAVACCWTMIGG